MPLRENSGGGKGEEKGGEEEKDVGMAIRLVIEGERMKEGIRKRDNRKKGELRVVAVKDLYDREIMERSLLLKGSSD